MSKQTQSRQVATIQFGGGGGGGDSSNGISSFHYSFISLLLGRVAMTFFYDFFQAFFIADLLIG